jgi:hypothetical protein
LNSAMLGAWIYDWTSFKLWLTLFIKNYRLYIWERLYLRLDRIWRTWLWKDVILFRAMLRRSIDILTWISKRLLLWLWQRTLSYLWCYNNWVLWSQLWLIYLDLWILLQNCGVCLITLFCNFWWETLLCKLIWKLIIESLLCCADCPLFPYDWNNNEKIK